jgi:DNA-binding MarR family transcriptional regulator
MASISNETKPLAERELRAWRGLLRTHAMLVKRLDAELEAEHGLALTSYEVLLHLNHSDGGKMRMCDVAESVLLSRSGLTRLVDRLERDGLVTRCGDDHDGRSRHAVLTEAGYGKLVEAQRTHLAGVRETFLARLTSEEREQLAAAWGRLAADSPTE